MWAHAGAFGAPLLGVGALLRGGGVPADGDGQVERHGAGSGRERKGEEEDEGSGTYCKGGLGIVFI